jgi:hypothetical protein
MSEVITKPESSRAASVRDNSPAVEVFAVYGVEPEVQAYAMAKYSRSALSMKESLKEITQQKAEKFLNTFYFQYGHRSIADLAHIALAIEKLSILAAIAVADEQRWDGQERSTLKRAIFTAIRLATFSRYTIPSRARCSNTSLA